MVEKICVVHGNFKLVNKRTCDPDAASHLHKYKKMNNHKDLIVHQKSLHLVELIYRITKSFPTEEKFGLTSQLRRSSVSLPSNIAAGADRKGPKEFIHFLYTALGSLNEMETQLEISLRLGYITDHNSFTDLFLHIKRMLLKLIDNLENRQTSKLLSPMLLHTFTPSHLHKLTFAN